MTSNPPIPNTAAPQTVGEVPLEGIVGGKATEAADASAAKARVDTDRLLAEGVDRTTAGQRAINLKWESTQQQIAIVVSYGTVGTCAGIIFFGPPDLKVPAFTLLSSICMVVLATYFQRTNHQKIGGVGIAEGGR